MEKAHEAIEKEVAMIKFDYAVIILKIETYLDFGMKFNIEVDKIIPFLDKELAEKYLEELKDMGINAILIDIRNML